MNPYRDFLPECRVWCRNYDHYINVKIEELEDLVRIRGKNNGSFTVSEELQLEKIGQDIFVLEKKLKNTYPNQVQKMFLGRNSIEKLGLLMPIIKAAVMRLDTKQARIFMDSEAKTLKYSGQLNKLTTLEEILKICSGNDTDDVRSRFRLEMLGGFPSFYFNEMIKRVHNDYA